MSLGGDDHGGAPELVGDIQVNLAFGLGSFQLVPSHAEDEHPLVETFLRLAVGGEEGGPGFLGIALGPGRVSRRPRGRRSFAAARGVLGALDLAFRSKGADFRDDLIPAQRLVHDLGNVFVDGDLLPVLDLDDHVESGGRLALQHRLLGAPEPGFLVAEGHGLHPAD